MNGWSNEWLAWGHFRHGAFKAITVLRNLKLSSHELMNEAKKILVILSHELGQL